MGAHPAARERDLTGPAARSIMDGIMEENAPSPSALAQVMGRLSQPKTLVHIALGLALGAAGAAAGWAVYLKPMRAIAATRYRSHVALMRLYDMELSYHAARGTYANDLDTLLASAPDGDKVRAQLKTSVDLNTLAVVGTASWFRLEANILDPERTAVKFRGPAPAGKR